MLFSYQYVPHQMEKMQEFIAFIFYEVWCKAPDSGSFSFDLFNGNMELKEVIKAFHFSDTKGADFFNGHVERIYELFGTLTPAQIDQFKQWFQANNDIEKVCANDPAVHVVRYPDIKAAHQELSEQLESFFKGLYSKDLLGLKVLKDKIGDITDHYKAFMAVNKVGKCPFCGIGDIKGIHHTKRDAYDHYLPKKSYPFNTINFHNLAPACHECNSTYKLSKDPISNALGRRKAFYPYAHSGCSIEVIINLSTSDIEHLTPDAVELELGPVAYNEEIDTWKDVYGIDERYKAKCCSADAKDWLEQIRILQDAHGIAPAAALVSVQQQTNKDPVANSNFLKKAFLEGCQRRGIF